MFTYLCIRLQQLSINLLVATQQRVQYTQMQQIGIFISQHEMGTESMPETTSRKDFFISYTSVDASWAEWIAAELEHAGYTTIIQAWDFRPGSNFLSEMDNAI